MAVAGSFKKSPTGYILAGRGGPRLEMETVSATRGDSRPAISIMGCRFLLTGCGFARARVCVGVGVGVGVGVCGCVWVWVWVWVCVGVFLAAFCSFTCIF